MNRRCPNCGIIAGLTRKCPCCGANLLIFEDRPLKWEKSAQTALDEKMLHEMIERSENDVTRLIEREKYAQCIREMKGEKE